MKSTLSNRILTGFVLLAFELGGFLASPAPVSAASPIYVTTWQDELNDPTPNSYCSLREAVIAANENRKVGGCTTGSAGLDTIILPANLKDQYNVTQDFIVKGSGDDTSRKGDLDILEPVSILGAGSGATTIASEGNDRVFHIIGLGSAEVTIQGVEITRGNANSVGGGGGILNVGSTLTLRNVLIYGNQANNFGGGGVRNNINLLVTPPVVPHLRIDNSTIDTNYTSWNGGGISNEGVMVINNSLVSNNSAAGAGGGVASSSPYSSRIANTTVTGNIGTNGAGIYSAGVLEVVNSTVAENRGSGTVYGLVVYDQTTITLKNTIISGHDFPEGSQDCQVGVGATVSSNGYNLISDASCGLNDTSLESTDPLLGSFDYHGGPTQLFGLSESSPAIDAGSNTECTLTDQRGVFFVRPADGDGDLVAVCDIGAYEKDALPGKLLYLPAILR